MIGAWVGGAGQHPYCGADVGRRDMGYGDNKASSLVTVSQHQTAQDRVTPILAQRMTGGDQLFTL
jgi:hypothetical protein